ncbi:hypothetical protein HDU98_002977 [Podochytrium sp. JEL0797]|nr:hypothetical protein HDU98_002977 [Podochytrium sp. JEL0797]
MLKKCRKCQSHFYCSVECQRSEWKAGHKSMCRGPLDFVEFDLVRVHGFKGAESAMNGNVWEIPPELGQLTVWVVFRICMLKKEERSTSSVVINPDV